MLLYVLLEIMMVCCVFVAAQPMQATDHKNTIRPGEAKEYHIILFGEAAVSYITFRKKKPCWHIASSKRNLQF